MGRPVTKGAFTVDDLFEQLTAIQKMGNLAELFDKSPFFPGGLPKELVVSKDELPRLRTIADSMTKEERENPAMFVVASGTRDWWVQYDDDRIQRVAKGAGCSTGDVETLVKRYLVCKRMITQMGEGSGLLRQLKDWLSGK
jgi:signal recognition particle subunit SRP54